jgi:hypothetical protein
MESPAGDTEFVVRLVVPLPVALLLPAVGLAAKLPENSIAPIVISEPELSPETVITCPDPDPADVIAYPIAITILAVPL